jgi:hypothetical protein
MPMTTVSSLVSLAHDEYNMSFLILRVLNMRLTFVREKVKQNMSSMLLSAAYETHTRVNASTPSVLLN